MCISFLGMLKSAEGFVRERFAPYSVENRD